MRPRHSPGRCTRTIASAGFRTSGWLDAAVILGGRALFAIGGILTVRISTEVLSPPMLGSVAQLTGLAALFALLLTSPIVQYVVRGFLEWCEAGTAVANLARYTAVIASATVLGFGAAALLQRALNLVNLFSPLTVAAVVAIYMFCYPLGVLGAAGFNLRRHRLIFVGLTNIPVWGGLGLSVLFYVHYRGALAWTLGLCAGQGLACLGLLLLIWRLRGENHPRTQNHRSLPGTISAVLNFGWPLSMVWGLWWIQSQNFRFLLAGPTAQAAIGLFAVGYGIAANVIGTFEVVFNQFYDPIFYGDLKNQNAPGQARAWERYAERYLPGLLLVCVFTISAAPFLTSVIVSEGVRSTVTTVLACTAVAEALRAAATTGHYLATARVDMRLLIPAGVVGAIASPTILLVLQGRVDPIISTAISLILSAALIIILVSNAMRRALPIRWPLARLIKSAFACLPLAVILFGIRWTLPTPSFLVSLFILGIGATYVLVWVLWWFRDGTTGTFPSGSE
jgi:hypothetical protein